MKKFFAAVLTVFLSLGLLTACGGGQQHGASSAPAVQSVERSDTGSADKSKSRIRQNKIYAEARSLAWKDTGTLDQVAPGKSIGGDRFSNYEKILPDAPGRSWKECDIDYVRGNRNAKRICFSNDGLIYYTSSHYQDFEKIY